jgi:hypothetical protein
VADPGEAAGVLVIQDRHTRDAAAVASRHDIAVHVPEWMTLAREKLETTAEPVGSEVPGTDYAVHRLIDTDEWEEAVFVDETAETMVVPEALGTLPAFRANDDALGVHPGLEEPPHRLADWEPDRLLVGHGESIHGGTDTELRRTLDAE